MPLVNLSVGMGVRVCDIEFVVFTDCESCARPISTNLRSMEEESEYELPSETCFTARRFEMVAVAGLLWLYFVACVFSVWWDFVFLFSFSSLRTHTAYCKYEVTLPHVPLY